MGDFVAWGKEKLGFWKYPHVRLFYNTLLGLMASNPELDQMSFFTVSRVLWSYDLTVLIVLRTTDQVPWLAWLSIGTLLLFAVITWDLGHRSSLVSIRGCQSGLVSLRIYQSASVNFTGGRIYDSHGVANLKRLSCLPRIELSTVI